MYNSAKTQCKDNKSHTAAYYNRTVQDSALHNTNQQYSTTKALCEWTSWEVVQELNITYILSIYTEQILQYSKITNSERKFIPYS